MSDTPRDIPDDLRDEQLDEMWALNEALKEAVDVMGRREVGDLVDSYYQVQKLRVAVGNRVSAFAEADTETLPELLSMMHDTYRRLESRLQWCMLRWCRNEPVAEWALSLYGVGPCIAAGLSAHIDIEKAPTVGRIWRFAGLDPTVLWLKEPETMAIVKEMVEATKPTDAEIASLCQKFGRKPSTIKRYMINKAGKFAQTKDALTKALRRRPHNAGLKQVAYHAAASFIKQPVEKCFYRERYEEFKAQEQMHNESGQHSEYAAKVLAAKPGHKQAAIYKEGRLPDGHIENQVRRKLMKLFLSHWHHVAYEIHYGCPPPNPYPFEHLGHGDIISPPNWPMENESEGTVV